MPALRSSWSARCFCSRPGVWWPVVPLNRSPRTRPSGARTWGSEMQAFLHQVLSGIAEGAIYASIALALVMIFKATHHVNFAQGEMAMFSTYIALALTQAGVSYWVAFVLTLV